MNKPATYGGQAVIEGVMIRGQRYMSVAVRRPAGDIARLLTPLSPLLTGRMKSIPLVRGVLTLAETLVLGMKALNFSATANLGESEGEMGKGSMALMLAFSLIFGVVLFFLIPLFASRPLEGVLGSNLVSNIAEGIIRLAIFLTYVWLIGKMADIRRVFMYHGAEHMTVHAQENGTPLKIDSVRKYSTAHPRCGTAFLLTVMLVAILVFVFVPRNPLWWLVTSRIILIPLIAAVSYELIRLSSRYSEHILVKLLFSPSLALQGLTTREPDDDQIEVAIEAMVQAINADKDYDAALNSISS